MRVLASLLCLCALCNAAMITVDLNGAGAGVDHGTTFVEDGVPVAIADPAATITYGAGPNLQKMVVVLVNPLDGAHEILSADNSDPTIDPIRP